MVMGLLELVLSVVLNTEVDSMEKTIMMNVYECRDRMKLAIKKDESGLHRRVEEQVSNILGAVKYAADHGKHLAYYDAYITSRKERKLIRDYLRVLGYRARWTWNIFDLYYTIKVKW